MTLAHGLQSIGFCTSQYFIWGKSCKLQSCSESLRTSPAASLSQEKERQLWEETSLFPFCRDLSKLADPKPRLRVKQGMNEAAFKSGRIGLVLLGRGNAITIIKKSQHK